MKTAFIFGFLALLAISAFAAEGDVVILTKDNFDSIVDNADIALVEFFAPWCGHCKKLAPEYAIAAEKLKKNDPPVILASVDATVETELGSRFGITSYPTLKIFRRGTPADYKGPREAKGIVSYMEKQAGPSAKPLDTLEAAKKFIEHHDAAIVGFFTAKKADSAAFTQVADALREDFRFGYVSDESIISALGASTGVSIFLPNKEKTKTYSGKYDFASLNAWVTQEAIPLVGEYSKNTQNRYARSKLPILKVFFDVDFGANLKRTNYYINRIKKVAEDPKYQGKLLFAVANMKDLKDETDKLKVDTSKEVGFAIDDASKNQKYRIDDAFSVESLKKLADGFLDGSIEAWIKSEPIPENNEAVKVVVGKNFNDIVMDDTKDVMFEMYAPWCGHCKKLEPTYKELAEKLQNVENVVIAKMDATANDSPHPKYQAKGYPTIFFAPAGNKENPVPYQGPREVTDMYNFIKNKASSWKEK